MSKGPELKGHPDWIAAAFDIADNEPPSVLAGYLDDNVEMRVGNGPTLKGKPAVVEALSAPSPVKSVRHDRVGIVLDGDQGVQQSMAHYTLHNGAVISIPVATYFRRTGEGLIDRAILYMDFAPVIAAASRAPAEA